MGDMILSKWFQAIERSKMGPGTFCSLSTGNGPGPAVDWQDYFIKFNHTNVMVFQRGRRPTYGQGHRPCCSRCVSRSVGSVTRAFSGRCQTGTPWTKTTTPWTAKSAAGSTSRHR